MRRSDLALVIGFLVLFVVLVSWLGRGRTRATAAVHQPDAAAVSAEDPTHDTSAAAPAASPPVDPSVAWIATVGERGYPWEFIVIHRSGGAGGDAASIMLAERQPHFVIGNGNGLASAEVQATSLWVEQEPGTHVGVPHVDRRAIGITLIGELSAAPPTPTEVEALSRLVVALCRRYDISASQVFGHGELGVFPTECPGAFVPVEQVRDAVERAGGVW